MRREITTAGMPWPESESASVGCGSPCSFVTSTRPAASAALAVVAARVAVQLPLRCTSRRLPAVAPDPQPVDARRGSPAPQLLGIATGPATTANGGPTRPVTTRGSPKMRSFVTAATVIASAALPGDETVPNPPSSPSLPAATTVGTPARAAPCDRPLDEVVAGPGLGLAERQVQDVHPVPDGAGRCARRSPPRCRRARTWASAWSARGSCRGRRRGDARQVGHADAVDHRRDPRVAGGDARDVGAVLGSDRIEGRVLARTAVGRWERAGDDHLAVDAVLQPLREARG